tara:strand:+ start:963 stop:1172 length:210 start_codon:yes stop_codon:yes gene_type:complete
MVAPNGRTKLDTPLEVLKLSLATLKVIGRVAALELVANAVINAGFPSLNRFIGVILVKKNKIVGRITTP